MCIVNAGHVSIRGRRQVFGKSSHHSNIFLMASISNARENLENISHCGRLYTVTCSWQHGEWDPSFPSNKEIG